MEKTIEGWTAGVGIAIHSSWIKHIVDIEPLGDRAMYIIIRSTMESTIMNAYIPGVFRPTEGNDKVY